MTEGGVAKISDFGEHEYAILSKVICMSVFNDNLFSWEFSFSRPGPLQVQDLPQHQEDRRGDSGLHVSSTWDQMLTSL